MDRDRDTRSGRAPLVAVLGACLLGPLAGAAEPPVPVLDLVWVDLTDLTARGPAPIERVSVEVRDLLAPLGVRVVWRVEAPGIAFPPSRTIVVLQRSNPDPTHARRLAGGAVAADPKGRRTLWVFPALVAGGLGLALERLPFWSFRHQHEFTRAMAVVVAHELQHLAGAGHAPEGLMAGTLGSSQLRDRQLEMDARLAPEVLSALSAPASPER